MTKNSWILLGKKVFTIADKRPVKENMVISREVKLGEKTKVAYFSMGQGTSISQESYNTWVIYIGGEGETIFVLNEEKQVVVRKDDILIIPEKTICERKTETGSIYTEIMSQKEIAMNPLLKMNEPMELKRLIEYEEGSIANLNLIYNDTMKYAIMAFDEDTVLTPHRASGNAIITALEGEAIIGYEGEEYEVKAGECFQLEKNGLHSVTAKGKFKMSFLLVTA